MEDVAKYETAEIQNHDETPIIVALEEFNKKLHEAPPKAEIQVNQHANNSRYIPISFLEMKLDEMFYGLWQTKNFRTQTVANEITGIIELEYFHPIAKHWITRTGAGAVMIQFKKDSDITDIGNKIKNTLAKDFPHLKAEAFRNACLSIGKSFGRDLNREYTDTYTPEFAVDVVRDEVLRDFLADYVDTIAVKDLRARAGDILNNAVNKKLNPAEIEEVKAIVNKRIIESRGKK